MADLRLREQEEKGHNSDIITLLSAATASDASRTSDWQDNMSASGIVLIVKLANEAGTSGFTPRIHIPDEDGTAIIYWSAAAELTANGTAVYVIYPAGTFGTAGSGVTAQVSMVIPRKWRLLLDYTTNGDGFDTEAYFYYLK
jgi:hypothetical protein